MPYVDPYSTLLSQRPENQYYGWDLTGNNTNGLVDESAMRGTATPYVDTSYLPTPTAADLAARGPYNPDAGSAFQQRSDSGLSLSGAAGGGLTNGITKDSSLTKNTWTGQHPLGTIAAFIAAAYGGSLLAGGAGGGAGAAGGAGGGGAGSLGSQIGSGLLSGAGSGAGSAAGGAVSGLGSGLAAGGVGAGVGFGGQGTGGLPSDLAGSFQNSQFGGAAGQLAQSGGIQGGAGTAGTGLANSTWGRLLTGAGRNLVSGGGDNSGGAAPAPMSLPSIGFMGSSVQPQAKRQFAPLNQTNTRSRAYGRTPIQFNGATIWV